MHEHPPIEGRVIRTLHQGASMMMGHIKTFIPLSQSQCQMTYGGAHGLLIDARIQPLLGCEGSMEKRLALSSLFLLSEVDRFLPPFCRNPKERKRNKILGFASRLQMKDGKRRLRYGESFEAETKIWYGL